MNKKQGLFLTSFFGLIALLWIYVAIADKGYVGGAAIACGVIVLLILVAVFIAFVIPAFISTVYERLETK